MSRTRTYVAAWAAVAATAALLVVAVEVVTGVASPVLSGDFAASRFAIGFFLVVTALAERVELRVHHGYAEESLTLIEAAVAANLLLFPASTALAITAGGVAIAQLLQLRAPLKSIFNVAQLTSASAAALGVFHLVRGGPALGGRDLVAGAVAMAAFGVVNGVAVGGIVALLERRPFKAVLHDSARLTGIVVMGNSAVGIIAAVLWTTRPETVPLLVVPAFTLRLAYRGVVRSGELLAEVAAERDRLDRIVVGASDGITLIGRDGRVEVWSPAMQRMTGVAPADAVGQLANELLVGTGPEGEHVDVLTPLHNARPGEPLTTVDMRLRHLEGGDRVVLARHTLLFDERRRCTGDVVLVHDVTREREVGRMKDDFVARVSHELRTPLTPILGFAQSMIRRGDVMDSTVRLKALGHIVERAQHMARLIEDLLLVSRISAGRAHLEDQVRPEPMDLVPLCERVLDGFRVANPDRAFHLECDQPLPEAMADPVRVEQILANLLSNACKYSEPFRSVHVGLSAEGTDEVRVSVSDEGRGIPAEQLEQVFERFHRLDDPLRMETSGLGLGLYIARQLAEAMRGRLEAASRLGVGSTFTLTLPTATTAPAADLATAQVG